jgi:hypothetical protein
MAHSVFARKPVASCVAESASPTGSLSRAQKAPL